MATPKYNVLVAKVRDWANKPEAATIPDSVIESCLAYSADECYRLLRIPPFETSVAYVVETADNVGDGGTNPNGAYAPAYTNFAIPQDMTQIVYVRTKAESTNVNNSNRVFNEITDRRGFHDIFYENYSAYNFMWSEGKIFIRPQLAVGTTLEIGYYKRLAPLDGLYAVLPINYVVGVADGSQTYLDVGVTTDTALYTSTFNAVTQCFSTSAEATTYAQGGAVTTHWFTGKEIDNWLRDQNERLLIWGALQNLGAYIFDDVMEKRYMMRFQEGIESLNREEKWRRTLGGNVQIHFNANAMI